MFSKEAAGSTWPLKHISEVRHHQGFISRLCKAAGSQVGHVSAVLLVSGHMGKGDQRGQASVCTQPTCAPLTEQGRGKTHSDKGLWEPQASLSRNNLDVQVQIRSKLHSAELLSLKCHFHNYVKHCASLQIKQRGAHQVLRHCCTETPPPNLQSKRGKEDGQGREEHRSLCLQEPCQLPVAEHALPVSPAPADIRSHHPT